MSGGLVPAGASTHYKRGGSPVLPSVPECGDSHELETLMCMDGHESAHLPEEASEDQRLMLSAPGDDEDLPPSDTKVKMIYMAKLFSFVPLLGFFFCNGLILVGIIVNLLRCRSYRLPGMAQ